MRLVIFTEPQRGASYADQLAIARHAEDLGFDGFFRSDHFLTMGTSTGLPGPTDAWATLAGLAVQTSRIRLGTLVTSATFRAPGLLAITVAQVDAMSGGRVELGIGAGWYEAEHRAYGLPFPPTGERFDRLAEQLAIVTGLWSTPTGQRFTYHGTHYDLVESPGLPKPVQSPHPPVIVGGTGPRRTPALAAAYADEYNVPFGSVAETAEAFGRVAAACEAAGRGTPPVYSAAQTILCGRTDAEVADRAARSGGPVPFLAGTPDRVAERIGEFAAIGATRLFLQVLDMTDLDHLDVIASGMAPLLAAA
jgi:F420-dependent oxidoreductase-like protein